MKIIGITGGVGAGKSTVLNILKDICNCRIIMADDEAKTLMNREEELGKAAVRLFGKDAFYPDGRLNTVYISGLMYNNPELKLQWTGLVHPAVNKKIIKMVEQAKSDDKLDYLFIEAALLLENNYDRICDEIWYIFADRETRIKRLADNRGYTKEKSESIIANQMSHEEYASKCDFIIDNGISIENTKKQLENKLEEYR